MTTIGQKKQLHDGNQSTDESAAQTNITVLFQRGQTIRDSSNLKAGDITILPVDIKYFITNIGKHNYIKATLCDFYPNLVVKRYMTIQ